MQDSVNQSLAGYVFFLSLKHKYFLLIVSLILGLFFYLVSLTMPVLYKSETTLMIAPSEIGGSGDVSNGLSALASLGGIKLSGGSANRDEIVLEIAKSRSFIISFIERHNISLAKNIEDKLTPLKRYKRFMERFSITRDKFSGLVSIVFLDTEKQSAKLILDLFVKDLNAHIKSRDIEKAKKSLAYLDAELKQSNQDAVKNMLYGLMEANYRKIAFANSTDEYALVVVDSPYIPETKNSPQTLALIFAGLLSGFFMGVLILHIRQS